MSTREVLAQGVGYKMVQYSFPFLNWFQDLSKFFNMSDINATRLPQFDRWKNPYVSENDNRTLTRGERWAQAAQH